MQVAQDSSLISERNYSNKQRPLPDMYNNVKIIYNTLNIEAWKEKLLELAKENSYLSEDRYFFNVLQVIKANRTFEIGFKCNPTSLLMHIQFRPHNYFFATTLGLLSGLVVSLVLISVLSLPLLFLIIPFILLAHYAAFRIWYLVSIEKYNRKGKIAAPGYIGELKALASKAAEFSSN